MKKVIIFCVVFILSFSLTENARAGENDTLTSNQMSVNHEVKKSRLTIGGYGEAVMTRNFYSDAWQRYTNAEQYKDAEGHGRFDLPHVVINLGYEFRRGWSMGTEIEFEHCGTGSSVEMEAEETGEYETEVERGGEVVLEQFWLQKSFSRAANIRAGMIIVPIGLTNQHHLPTEFFTSYRQEGENTILPCTWHEVGVTFFGYAGKWRYEAMFLPGLDSDRFGSEGFIHDGSGSPYEFKIANVYAGAARLDNYSVKNLRLGLSGYIGQSFDNSLTNNTKYKGCHGEVFIGALDFTYDNDKIIARGNVDYAHLNDSQEITEFNKNNMSSESPSPKTAVASDAFIASIEIGYDIFSPIKKLHADNQRFYIFGHYEYYNSMLNTADGIMQYKWCGKHRIAVGINYYPIKEIVVKAEFSERFFTSEYNNEPSISLSIAYSGFFKK